MPSGSCRRVGLALLAAAIPVACGGEPRASHPLGPDASSPSPTVTGEPIDPMDIGAGWIDSPPLPPLVDNVAAYDPADHGPVNVSVTVQDAPAFAAVETDTPDARAAVMFAATNYAVNGTAVKATIELRGSTSRTAIQKSYQIKLAADAPPWRGSRTINLLKHPFDLTRVRNALSFQYARSIGNFTSLRTGFVHLFIDSV